MDASDLTEWSCGCSRFWHVVVVVAVAVDAVDAVVAIVTVVAVVAVVAVANLVTPPLSKQDHLFALCCLVITTGLDRWSNMQHCNSVGFSYGRWWSCPWLKQGIHKQTNLNVSALVLAVCRSAVYFMISSRSSDNGDTSSGSCAQCWQQQGELSSGNTGCRSRIAATPTGQIKRTTTTKTTTTSIRTPPPPPTTPPTTTTTTTTGTTTPPPTTTT